MHPPLTEHARARMQQRGISPAALELLLAYGREEHDHRGCRIVRFQDEYLSVGMERSASGGFRIAQWVRRQDVCEIGHEPRGRECLLDVVALEIHVGIDLMRHAVVAPIALEADVVRGGADPQRGSLDLKWRLPYA